MTQKTKYKPKGGKLPNSGRKAVPDAVKRWVTIQSKTEVIIKGKYGSLSKGIEALANQEIQPCCPE